MKLLSNEIPGFYSPRPPPSLSLSSIFPRPPCPESVSRRSFCSVLCLTNFPAPKSSLSYPPLISSLLSLLSPAIASSSKCHILPSTIHHPPSSLHYRSFIQSRSLYPTSASSRLDRFPIVYLLFSLSCPALLPVSCEHSRNDNILSDAFIHASLVPSLLSSCYLRDFNRTPVLIAFVVSFDCEFYECCQSLVLLYSLYMSVSVPFESDPLFLHSLVSCKHFTSSFTVHLILLPVPFPSCLSTFLAFFCAIVLSSSSLPNQLPHYLTPSLLHPYLCSKPICLLQKLQSCPFNPNSLIVSLTFALPPLQPSPFVAPLTPIFYTDSFCIPSHPVTYFSPPHLTNGSEKS